MIVLPSQLEPDWPSLNKREKKHDCNAVVLPSCHTSKLCCPFIGLYCWGGCSLGARSPKTSDKVHKDINFLCFFLHKKVWLPKGQTHYELILYSGKLSREKTFANFAVLWLFVKVFSVKFGGVASFGTVKANNPQKFSPRKSDFSPIHKNFLPRKFPAIWCTNQEHAMMSFYGGGSTHGRCWFCSN